MMLGDRSDILRSLSMLDVLQEAEARLHPRRCAVMLESSYSYKKLYPCDEWLQLDGPPGRTQLHCITHAWVEWKDTRAE